MAQKTNDERYVWNEKSRSLVRWDSREQADRRAANIDVQILAKLET